MVRTCEGSVTMHSRSDGAYTGAADATVQGGRCSHASGARAGGRIGSIDVLKFLLAVAIVIAHAGNGSFGEGPYHLQQAGIAVEGFFCISGCLLCISAESDAARSDGSLGKDTWQFLWRKVEGLIPPFIVAVVIYLCCWCADTGAALLAGGGASVTSSARSCAGPPTSCSSTWRVSCRTRSW